VAGIVSFFDEEKEVEDEGVRSFMQRAKALRALGWAGRSVGCVRETNGSNIRLQQHVQ
jgi:hypothetical protein